MRRAGERASERRGDRGRDGQGEGEGRGRACGCSQHPRPPGRTRHCLLKGPSGAGTARRVGRQQRARARGASASGTPETF